MNTADPIYTRLLEIWDERFGPKANVWMPLVPAPVKQAPLLFVWLNPSFGEGGFRRLLADTRHAKIDAKEFFHWRNRDKFNPQVARGIEEIARKKICLLSHFR